MNHHSSKSNNFYPCNGGTRCGLLGSAYGKRGYRQYFLFTAFTTTLLLWADSIFFVSFIAFSYYVGSYLKSELHNLSRELGKFSSFFLARFYIYMKFSCIYGRFFLLKYLQSFIIPKGTKGFWIDMFYKTILFIDRNTSDVLSLA